MFTPVFTCDKGGDWIVAFDNLLFTTREKAVQFGERHKAKVVLPFNFGSIITRPTAADLCIGAMGFTFNGKVVELKCENPRVAGALKVVNTVASDGMNFSTQVRICEVVGENDDVKLS